MTRPSSTLHNPDERRGGPYVAPDDDADDAATFVRVPSERLPEALQRVLLMGRRAVAWNVSSADNLSEFSSITLELPINFERSQRAIT